MEPCYAAHVSLDCGLSSGIQRIHVQKMRKLSGAVARGVFLSRFPGKGQLMPEVQINTLRYALHYEIHFTEYVGMTAHKNWDF